MFHHLIIEKNGHRRLLQKNMGKYSYWIYIKQLQIILYIMNLTICQSSQKSNLTHLTDDQKDIHSRHQINKQTTKTNISILKQQQYIKQPISHMDKINQTTSISMAHHPQRTYIDENKSRQFKTQSQSSQSMLLDSQRTSIADETPVHYTQNRNVLNSVQTLKQIPQNQSEYKSVSKKLFNHDQLQTSLSLTQISSSCPQNRQSLKYSSSNNQSPSEGKQKGEIRKQKKSQICWTCAQNEYNVQSPLIRTTSSNKQQKQSPYLSYNKISPFDLVPMSTDNKEQNLLEELQQDYTPYPAPQNFIYNYQDSNTDSVPKLSAFQYRYGSSDIIYEQHLENEQDEQSTKQIYLYPNSQNNGLVSQLEEQPIPPCKLVYDKQSRILPSLHIDNHKWNNENHPDNDHTLLGGQAIKDLFKQFYTNGPIFKNSRNRLLQKNENLENTKKSPFKKVKSIQKIVYQAQQKIIKQKPISNPLNVAPAGRINHCNQRAIILQINIIQDPYKISPLVEDAEQIKSLYLKNIRPEEIRHVNDPDTDSRYAHEQPLADFIQSIRVPEQNRIQLFQLPEGKNQTIHEDGLIVSGSTQQTKDIEVQSCQSTPVQNKYKGERTQQKEQREEREQKIEKKTKIIKISTEQKNKPQIKIDKALIGECDSGVQGIKIINNSQSQGQKIMNSPNRVRDRIKVFIRTKNSKANNNIGDYNSQSAQTVQLTNSSNFDKKYCLHPNIPSNTHLNNITSLYNVHTQYSHEDTEQNQQPHQLNKQPPHKQVIKITKNTKDISYLNPPKNTPNYSPIVNKQDDQFNIKINKNPQVTISYDNSVALSPRKHKIDIVSHSNYTSSAPFYDHKQQVNTKCSMINKNKISTPFLFCASPETEPPSEHIHNGKKKLLNLNGKSQKPNKIVSSKTDHNLSPHKKWIELSAPRVQAKDKIKWEIIESEIDEQRNRREEIQKDIKYLSNFTKLNNPTNPITNINRKNKHMAVNQLNNNIGSSTNPKYWPTHS